MNTDDTLILGGGPAGMAAAMELVRSKKTVTIIEKASTVGGLAKTLEFKEPEGLYRTDIGPHRFFSKNQYLYGFISDLLGEEWKEVPRLTRFYVDGKYYFYPVRLTNILRQLGILDSFRVFRDFAWEKIRSKIAPRNPKNFEDYCVMNFGRRLARFNMLNYTEKIWGIPCSQISVDWALQRIGGLSVWAALKKMLFGRSGAKSLVDSFFYPSRGSGTIYEAIAKRIQEQGNEVRTNAEPVKIRWEQHRVTEVSIKHSESIETVQPKHVVSSVPVTQLLSLFDPLPPTEVVQAASSLRFRSQVYVFLTIDREFVTKDNWIYFPDQSIPFGRISEMKNFSKDMCPPGKTSLFVEYFCFSGDAIWSKSNDDMKELTITWLEKLHFITRSEVLNTYHYRQEHVYPIYDLQYRAHLDTVLKWLDQFENFYAIGRPGRFRYTNQDHSLEMGILAAQSILTGRRHEMEDVGAEKEYFERGYIPTSQMVSG